MTENDNKDDGFDFAAMLDADAAEREHDFFNPGDLVAGTIVLISKDSVFIDYGGKAEAWASKEEFKDDDGNLTVSVGDHVELKFLEMGSSGMHLGHSLRAAGGESAKIMLSQAHNAGVPVEGTVKSTRKGGFDVEFSGVEAFCPISQIDIAYCEEPEVFVGTTHSFKVIEFDERGRRIVVSRRALLEEQREELAVQTRKKLEIDAEFDGVVTRIAAFGAFVDIGGIDGLVHISELSRQHVTDPRSVVKEGDAVRVKVLKIEVDDKGRDKIGLSIKALESDPWEDGLPFKEGDSITGTVRRIEPFGAFVELVPGVDGLVHVSEIAWERVELPQEKLEIGQAISVAVLGVDYEKQRVSLSVKQLLEPPAPKQQQSASDDDQTRHGNVIRRRKSTDSEDANPQEEEIAVEDATFVDAWGEAEKADESLIPEKPEFTIPVIGMAVRGVIRDIKPYGCFVDLPECGPKASGLLHISEYGGGEGNKNNPNYKEGDSVDLEIIKIDEKGRISVSAKALELRKERDSVKAYQAKANDEAKMGTFGDLLKKVKL